MERMKRPMVWASVAVAAMLLAVPLAHAQGVAKQVKEEINRAGELSKIKQYDKQLEVYDKLLADPDVRKDPLSGPIMVLAVQAAGAAKRADEVIRRAGEYMKGKLDERDQAVILCCLARAYLEKGEAGQAVEAANRVLALGNTDEQARDEAKAVVSEAKGTPEDEQQMQAYRNLYDTQMKAEDPEGAVATVRTMLRCAVSEFARLSPDTKTLPTDVIADLSRRGKKHEADRLTKELLATAKQRDLDEGVKKWCVVTAFQAYASSGDFQEAMKVFRENAAAFPSPPRNFPSMVKQAAEASSKKELTAGQAVTMGEEATSNVTDDVAFALKWYSKNDPLGTITYYGLLEAVENMYEKQGNRLSMARLMEEIIRNLPQDYSVDEKWKLYALTWKYRAVEIYIDNNEPKEARRVLLELEKKWPASHDVKAGLLLAKINEGANPNDAIEGLQKLHGTTADSTGWFKSGETLAEMYEKRGQWDKALALRKEMGAKDSTRLGTYAYQRFTQKRIEDALDLYQQLRVQEPTNTRAYLNEAKMLRMLKRHEEFVQVCDKMADLFPPGPELEGMLLQSARTRLVELGRFEEAERNYRRFLATYPKSEARLAANLELIRALHQLGKHEEVIAQGKEFLPKATADWMSTEVRDYMADAYTALGQDEEAAKIRGENP